MSLSIAQIEANLMRLEAEVAEALRQVRQVSVTPEEWEQAWIARTHAENERLRPYIQKVFEEMLGSEEPPSAEEVREMIAACGVRPEDNLFSRMIIEMRER